MSRKKRKKAATAAAVSAPTANGTARVASAAPDGPNLQLQRLVAMLGFGLCGLLVGFLTGANNVAHVPPGLSESILAQAGWIGASVGSQTLDILAGLSGALLGGAVGSTLGFSLFLAPGAMLMSWSAGAVLLTVAMTVGGGPALGAIGWMAGYSPFLLQEFLHSK